jgi:cysteine desulfuration protein SufE
MNLRTDYPNRLLLDEYAALDTAEDRLSWLMDRESAHSDLLESDMTPEKRVPGCVSGLWLKAVVREGICSFYARSESPMVSGVVTFLCELYSGLSPEDVITLATTIPGKLALEGLLSTTRKRAVSSAISFFRHTAQQHLDTPAAA